MNNHLISLSICSEQVTAWLYRPWPAPLPLACLPPAIPGCVLRRCCSQPCSFPRHALPETDSWRLISSTARVKHLFPTLFNHEIKYVCVHLLIECQSDLVSLIIFGVCVCVFVSRDGGALSDVSRWLPASDSCADTTGEHQYLSVPESQSTVSRLQ